MAEYATFQQGTSTGQVSTNYEDLPEYLKAQRRKEDEARRLKQEGEAVAPETPNYDGGFGRSLTGRLAIDTPQRSSPDQYSPDWLKEADRIIAEKEERRRDVHAVNEYLKNLPPVDDEPDEETVLSREERERELVAREEAMNVQSQGQEPQKGLMGLVGGVEPTLHGFSDVQQRDYAGGESKKKSIPESLYGGWFDIKPGKKESYQGEALSHEEQVNVKAAEEKRIKRLAGLSGEGPMGFRKKPPPTKEDETTEQAPLSVSADGVPLASEARAVASGDDKRLNDILKKDSSELNKPENKHLKAVLQRMHDSGELKDLDERKRVEVQKASSTAFNQAKAAMMKVWSDLTEKDQKSLNSDAMVEPKGTGHGKAKNRSPFTVNGNVKTLAHAASGGDDLNASQWPEAFTQKYMELMNKAGYQVIDERAAWSAANSKERGLGRGAMHVSMLPHDAAKEIRVETPRYAVGLKGFSTKYTTLKEYNRLKETPEYKQRKSDYFLARKVAKKLSTKKIKFSEAFHEAGGQGTVKADVSKSLPIRYTPKVAKDNLHDDGVTPTEKLILLRGTARTGKIIWAKVMTEDGRVGWVNAKRLTSSLGGKPEIN